MRQTIFASVLRSILALASELQLAI